MLPLEPKGVTGDGVGGAPGRKEDTTGERVVGDVKAARARSDQLVTAALSVDPGVIEALSGVCMPLTA